MSKLNQIIALSNGAKTRTQSGITQLYHKLQQGSLMSGIERTYEPKDDEGDKLPPESNKVQVRAKDVVGDAGLLWAKLFDIVATQDATNCVAKADVRINGKPLLSEVPVTHLLFLEKQLNDIRTFVGKIPTLDPAYDWGVSREADCYVAEPIKTTKTKKVLRNHVKAKATKEHPEQVEVYTEDTIVGYWTKRDFSGAIPVIEKRDCLNKISLLQDAVKAAREEANSIEVVQKKYGKAVMDYLFDTPQAKP